MFPEHLQRAVTHDLLDRHHVQAVLEKLHGEGAAENMASILVRAEQVPAAEANPTGAASESWGRWGFSSEILLPPRTLFCQSFCQSLPFWSLAHQLVGLATTTQSRS